MLRLLVLAACLAAVALRAHAVTDEEQARIDATCPVRRAQALHCVIEEVDGDKDGRVTPDEIRTYRNNLLRLLEPVFFFLNVMPEKKAHFQSFIDGETVEKIMEHCDANHDGAVTVEDAAAAEHTCMAHCRDRRVFAAVCAVSECRWYEGPLCAFKLVKNLVALEF